MKAVILAGGFGTRLSEETIDRPKPMIGIGGKPILWHIMKLYSHYNINEFIICCGYKGYVIKEYFSNYFLHMSDVTFDIRDNTLSVHDQRAEPWRVTLVDTGDHSMTGGRLRRIAKFVEGDSEFFLTYGDGVGDIDIAATLEFHRGHGKLATITAVVPPGRFGAVQLKKGKVTGFREKPEGEGGLINGGFFVLSPSVLDYIDDDNTVWEETPLADLTRDEELMAYEHRGFWQPMDTLRDKMLLENLWNTNSAPWKVWE